VSGHPSRSYPCPYVPTITNWLSRTFNYESPPNFISNIRNQAINWNMKTRIRNNVVRVELSYTFHFLTINFFTIIFLNMCIFFLNILLNMCIFFRFTVILNIRMSNVFCFHFYFRFMMKINSTSMSATLSTSKTSIDP
jgi:hypothetical protein